MTYPYPGDLYTVTNLLYQKIDGAKATLLPLAVAAVYYGDQDIVPVTPAVCIEPGSRTRTLQGAPNMTLNEFEVYILVYHAKVQDDMTTRKEVDQVAYSLEKLIHQDLQLKNGGATPNMIHGFVRSHESGIKYMQNTLYRSARLTYYGQNKTSLPTA